MSLLLLTLMQAAPMVGEPSPAPDPLVVRAPRWEDIPRPFRTGAEDCVWVYVQERIEAGENVVGEADAEQIGRDSVKVCEESISAWVDNLSEREVRHGELREFTSSRVQAHMVARAVEFALGASKRFYIDEDRGENTQPSFQMSNTCDAQMRRAQQLRQNAFERVEEAREELRDVPLEEWQSLQYYPVFMEIMSEVELSATRIQVVQRRCPQFIPDASDPTVLVPEGMR